MYFKFERLLDQIGLKILNELQMNARISFSEIGRRVGLSSPAVAERVKKMEEAGIICGYHANVDHEKIGFPILAFIFLTTKSEKYDKVYEFAENTQEISECHCISGSESFILRVLSDSLSQLDALVDKLSKFGDTKTSIVLSSPVKKATIGI
jgi:Lrp/AsnC family transcriptional regulator, leucine-responsive regulatory protein